jgi:uncharacterized membrane protein
MGILDNIFGKKEEESGKGPFSLKTSLSPVRMTAYKITSVDLTIKVKNLSKEPSLTSIMIQVPKGLGLDQTGIAKAKELRLGYLNKGEEKDIVVPIWGNVTTAPGDYKIGLEVFCHYRTYAYIQNSVRKIVELRVV